MRALLLFTLLLAACGEEDSDSDTNLDDTDVEDTDPADTDDTEDTDAAAERGQEIHDTVCMECHQHNDVFETRVPTLADADIFDQVKNGGGYMPAQDLSDDQIDDVIVYLRLTYGGPP
jgi:mono/diheme cytochrome c family protein